MIARSRIHEFINRELLIKLYSIAADVLIPDNNTKMELFIAAFEEFNVPYQELGPGTNRGAFLIDGYVFKIGFDKAGMADNRREFSLAQELQPFVTKCYECTANGLIAIAEYVTVISKEEFQNSKDEVRQILSHLADAYLLGDVGSVNKNFMNWGYREDGSLVILDYAYIYRVIGDEMQCVEVNKDDTTCGGLLEYDINFHKLICPKCRKEYTFHEIRRRIDPEYEEKEVSAIENIAYKLTQPRQEVQKNQSNDIVEDVNNNEGDNDTMGKHNKKHEEHSITYNEMDSYLAAMEFMGDSNDENCDDYNTNIEVESDALVTDVDDINGIESVETDVDSEDDTDNESICGSSDRSNIIDDIDETSMHQSSIISVQLGNVDEMRAMLINDIDDKYSDYDDVYGSGGFQKSPKRQRDFS